MRKLFVAKDKQTSKSGRSSLFCWNPRGHLLAVATFQESVKQSTVVLYNRQGEQTNQVSISDAEQREFDSMGQAKTISHIEWDSRGEKIAIQCKNSSIISIWSTTTGEMYKVELGVKHSATFITWHLTQPILAIGTDKGSLILYNDDRKQKVVLVGYHSKALTCSAWSDEGFLALGSTDNQVSIMRPKVGTEEGEESQLNKMALKGEPISIAFAPIARKESSVAPGIVRVSINVNRRSVYLLDIKKEEGKSTTSTPKHSEIVVEDNYGRILVHSWYREQYIVAGTDTGYIMIMSTETNQNTKHVHPFRFFRDPISDLSVSDTCSLDVSYQAGTRKENNVPENAGKQTKSVLACCGSRNVLILDITKPSAAVEIMSHTLSNVSEGRSKSSDAGKGAGKRRGSLHRWAAGSGAGDTVKESGNCEHLCWTSDGQIISVSSQDGSVHSLLVSLPIVGASCVSRIAYLTSLAEVSIVDIHEGESQAKSKTNVMISSSGDMDSKDSQDNAQKQSLLSCSILANIKTETEPSFCALGPSHVAVALNNECWFYSEETSGMPQLHLDYITSIESICLNSKHAAVLSEGRIHLHRIGAHGAVGNEDMGKNEIILPGNSGSSIMSVAMTENFLIAGTGSGSICYWLVNDPSSGMSWDEDSSNDSDPSQSNLVPPPQINEYRHGHKQEDLLGNRGSTTINSAIVDDEYGSPRKISSSQYAISSIVPNASGTHLLFSDVRRQVFFFNAVNDQVLPILPPAGTNFVFQQNRDMAPVDDMSSSKATKMVPSILWDIDDPNVFIVFAERTHGESLAFGNKHQTLSDSNNNGFIAVYVYVPTSTSGSEIKLAGMHALRSLPGKPLLLSKGFLIFLTGSVNLERVLLDTHKHIMAKYSLQQVESKKGRNMVLSTSANASKHDRLVGYEFDQHVALNHMEEAKEIAMLSRDRSMWITFASQALSTLNIDMAILGYRMAGDSSKASALSRLRHVEDKHLLAGHALLVLGESMNKNDRSVVEIAESYFFRSSEPKAALEMHIDLKNWERALELADNVTASDMEKANINKQHASTLELRGEYQAARRAYDIAINLFGSCLPRRESQGFQGTLGFGDRDLEESINAEFGSDFDDYGRAMREGDSGAAKDNNGEGELPADEVSVQEVEDQIKVCKGGIARCIIHLGDVEAGVQIALELAQEQEGSMNNNEAAYKRKMDMFQDFAIILEEAGHLIEAAEMHHVCGNVEQAATLFVKSKQFDKAKPLMTQVMAPSLHQVFAKSMEMRGDYQLALSSYQRANDSQSLVRLYLSNNSIKNTHKAFAIVRQTKSLESAKLALQYCLDKGDHEGQTEMLVILGRINEAMELAIVHNTVDALVSNIKNSEAEPQVYLQIAKYYEQHSQFLKAGMMYETCCKSASLRPNLAENLVPSGDFYAEESTNGSISEFIDACNNSAVHFYLKDGTSEAIDSAIALVGRVRSSSQIAQVVDWLADQTQSTSSAASKEGARHLFELHIALGDLVRAAHVACVLSRQEQDMGNYKLAHEQVHHAYCELSGELRKQKLQTEDSSFGANDKAENENPNAERLVDASKSKVSGSPGRGSSKASSEENVLSELLRQLVVLHSYVLVKTYVKVGDHLSAARLLVRVSKHISKFPAHIVPILTSTVIECQRAGLKWAAYEHASILMRDPDYRSQVAPTYKRKIENIIRKPDPALKLAKAQKEEGGEAAAIGDSSGEDAKELLSKCPNCGSIGSEYDLQCQHCKIMVPFCSASGKRMAAEDWGVCKSCSFPFRCSSMRALFDKGETRCQLCHTSLGTDALLPLPFTKDLLQV